MIHSKIKFFSPFHLKMEFSLINTLLISFIIWMGEEFLIFGSSAILLIKIDDWFQIFISLREKHFDKWIKIRDGKFFRIVEKTKWLFYSIGLGIIIYELNNLFISENIVDRMGYMVIIILMMLYNMIFYQRTKQI